MGALLGDGRDAAAAGYAHRSRRADPQQERGMTSIEQLLAHLAEINRQQREVYDSRRGMPELTPEEPLRRWLQFS